MWQQDRSRLEAANRDDLCQFRWYIAKNTSEWRGNNA